jgi:hypothetical protein
MQERFHFRVQVQRAFQCKSFSISSLQGFYFRNLYNEACDTFEPGKPPHFGTFAVLESGVFLFPFQLNFIREREACKRSLWRLVLNTSWIPVRSGTHCIPRRSRSWRNYSVAHGESNSPPQLHWPQRTFGQQSLGVKFSPKRKQSNTMLAVLRQFPSAPWPGLLSISSDAVAG